MEQVSGAPLAAGSLCGPQDLPHLGTPSFLSSVISGERCSKVNTYRLTPICDTSTQHLSTAKEKVPGCAVLTGEPHSRTGLWNRVCSLCPALFTESREASLSGGRQQRISLQQTDCRLPPAFTGFHPSATGEGGESRVGAGRPPPEPHPDKLKT